MVKYGGNKMSKMSMFLSRNELMDIMGISSCTLARYMRDGLPHFKFKGRVLFNNDKIQEFFKEHTIS